MRSEMKSRWLVVLGTALFATSLFTPTASFASDLVFGPVTCQRGTGAPTVFNYSFSAPQSSQGFIFKVYNGGLEDTTYELVSSSTITLNGIQILGPNNFNQNVSYLEVPVTLQAQNSLGVEVRGKQGGTLVVKVYTYTPSAPTATLTAMPSQIQIGTESTLEWSTSGATEVFLSPGIGNIAPSGSMAVSPSVTTTYALTAIGPDGTATATTTVVVASTMPSVTFAASPGTILEGSSSSLSWMASNVASCSIEPGVGGVTVSGSLNVSPQVTTFYTITCSGSGGTTTASTTVNVNYLQPIASLTAAPVSIPQGASSTLSWTSSHAQTCSIDSGVGSVPCNGSISVAPNTTIMYVLTAIGFGGTTSASATVSISNLLPTIVLRALPEAVLLGEPCQISWTSNNATSLSIDQGIGVVPVSGTRAISPSETMTYTATATGPAGTTTSKITVKVSWAPITIPDPDSVAPSVDTTVATTLIYATEFLYTGANPIQIGVAPGTIEPKRVAVVRGRVLDSDGTAMAGVVISILNHPEFGYTATRFDGMFDLAMNGGSWTTVKYAKEGYIPVQRQVDVPWQDYAWLPDVVMLGHDSKVTTIDLTAGIPMQVAQGNPVTDIDGTRQATLLFPEGLTAIIDLPDGQMQSLTNLSVRATEYTIGPNGPKAMPAPLPPTSGYTYAAEYSVDEAVAAGALDVRFNKPVISYIENFLDFPVGGIVPVGYYDRRVGNWIPSKNGRIVEILSINSGLAELDIDGSGVAAEAAALASLGVTDSERERLANLYQSGQSLWRVGITHFSPWDCNWPYGPPVGAVAPNQPEAKVNDKLDDPTCRSGSIIECQSQVLRESIGITGTPFSLNYSSDRAPGRIAERALEIPISGPTVPANLKRIDLEIYIAGRQFNQSFSAAANQMYAYIWDGKDAYGRDLYGKQTATVRIGYVYQMVYYQPAEFDQSFGAISGIPMSSGRNSMEIVLWQQQMTSVGMYVGGIVNGANALGTWTLNEQHAYDTIGQILYLGNGGRRSAKGMDGTITSVAGTGSQGYSGDGGPARNAKIGPYALALDGQGNIFIADIHRIRKVSEDGIITTVAGNGSPGFSGDGGPALNAQLDSPVAVAVDGQGNIFIADFQNCRIRKVRPDGIINTVAGNGTYGGFEGDGAPAVNTQLSPPTGVTADGYGNLFITEVFNHKIRKVGPDGILTTVAGNGEQGYNGDGIPAVSAKLNTPTGSVAIDSQGNMFIADQRNGRVRKVGPDGIITTVAGSGITWRPTIDGIPATNASLWDPRGVAVDGQGNLFIADFLSHQIRKVSADGIITTVSGKGTNEFSDGNLAASTRIDFPYSLIVDEQSNLLFSPINMWLSARIFKISKPLPGFSGQDIVIASEDAVDLYGFNATGKHLRTLDALTGAVKYSFSYDTAGMLISVTDRDDNITIVERDASGNATAIIAPGGQRTDLSLDANGYLSSVTNPAGEAINLTYTIDGLLSTLTDPKGNVHNYIYDDLGRLTKDQNPAGGYSSLSRTESVDSYTVALATALGRTNTYQVERLSTGDTRRVDTYPDGMNTTTIKFTNGTRNITSPDGTVSSVTEGPDPRFGMQAPLISNMNITTPGGLAYSMSGGRTVTLSDVTNPLSLITLTDTLNINGRAYTNAYAAATKTFTTTTPAGRQIINVLDNLGRISQTQVPGLDPINYTYDTQGRLTDVTQGVRQYSVYYDNLNQIFEIADPLTRSTGFSYDLAGRVIQQTLPDTNAVAYAYDDNGNVTTITPPGKPEHGFSYSPVDLVKNYSPPLLDFGSAGVTYDYNLDKQIVQITRPSGQSTSFGYDGSGRLSVLETPQGSTFYGYDASSGRLDSITTPNGESISYSYDGPLVTSKTWSGIINGSVSLSYNNDFLVTSENVNGTNSVNLIYDNDRLLIGVGSLSIARSAQNGLITGTTLGSVNTSYAYNGTGETNQFSTNTGGSPFFDVQYVRDNLGRITQKTETVEGVTNTYLYEYNTAGSLVDVTTNGVISGSYVYDANGNRLSCTSPNGTVTGNIDNQDRLTAYGSNVYEYTANGDLLSQTAGGQISTYTYDALGNLLSVTLPDSTLIEYVIDGQNRRIGKKINGVLQQAFLYQNQLRPVAELNGAGAVVSRFFYGTRANVPDYMINGGSTYRIVTDHLGSPRLVIDTASGTIVQRVDYDEFGNIVQDTNPGFQPFGFAGGLYDQHTKLTRFGARDYNAESGRFTAKDPIDFAGGDTNLYAYVMNDPVNMVDSDGLMGVPISLIKKALKKVHGRLGGWLPKGKLGKFGSPQRGTPEKGYRLDPPHPGAEAGSAECGPHINWWDFTKGKRGSGGISGAERIMGALGALEIIAEDLLDPLDAISGELGRPEDYDPRLAPVEMVPSH